MGEDARDLALPPLGVGHARKDRVPVQRAAHAVGRDEEVLLAALGHDKAEPARVALQPAADHAQGFGAGIALFAGLDQAPFLDHGLQDRQDLVLRNLQGLGDRLCALRSLLQQGLDLLLPLGPSLCFHLSHSPFLVSPSVYHRRRGKDTIPV